MDCFSSGSQLTVRTASIARKASDEAIGYRLAGLLRCARYDRNAVTYFEGIIEFIYSKHYKQ
jgi:hypothetical protein